MGNSRFLSTTFQAQRAGQHMTVGVAGRAGRMAPCTRNVRVRVFLDGREYEQDRSLRSTDSADIAQAHDLRANCYISKPTDLDQLIRIGQQIATL